MAWLVRRWGGLFRVLKKEGPFLLTKSLTTNRVHGRESPCVWCNWVFWLGMLFDGQARQIRLLGGLSDIMPVKPLRHKRWAYADDGDDVIDYGDQSRRRSSLAFRQRADVNHGCRPRPRPPPPLFTPALCDGWGRGVADLRNQPNRSQRAQNNANSKIKYASLYWNFFYFNISSNNFKNLIHNLKKSFKIPKILPFLSIYWHWI